MRPFYLLDNPIRNYAWGDTDFIPRLLGNPNPGKEPQAEMWMGVHPAAPSMLREPRMSLGEFIALSPEDCLGPRFRESYGGLPFLFKILAAARSLSIQAHPDKKHAVLGFAEEQTAGKRMDDPARNYRDDNHKPEIIMALTPFTAMMGFREPGEIAGNFRSLDDGSLAELLARLDHRGDAALPEFLETLLSLNEKTLRSLLDGVHARLEGGKDDPALRRTAELAEQFPGDPGSLAPLMLNLVELKPGQALYQPARTLHAYLKGAGLELMANSDNVLRGGLTSKHVDVNELLRVLDFHPTPPSVLALQPSGEDGVERFLTPAEEFTLSLASVDGSAVTLRGRRSPRIMLCLEGTLTLGAEGSTLPFPAGTAVFLPWKGGDLSIGGRGRAAAAEINTSLPFGSPQIGAYEL